ncbi:hypothetical protein L249_7998, partial [Ophiocordyceps polyrhachis-furcata BCC 54312]
MYLLFTREEVPTSTFHALRSPSPPPQKNSSLTEGQKHPLIFFHPISSIRLDHLPRIRIMATASGFGDHDKLAAAKELAQSFKPAKAKGYRPVQNVPKRPTMSFEAEGSCQTLGASVPQPSQRHYVGLGKFGAPTQKMNQKQLVGKSGLEFLRRVDNTEDPVAAEVEETMAAKDSGKTAAIRASPPAATATTTPLEPKGESLVIQAKPKNIAKGSLLETFYAVVEDSESSSNVASPAEMKQETLIDFDDGAGGVDVLASTIPKTLTLLVPTPAASTPSPIVDVSEVKPQKVVDEKPSVHVSDEKPKAGHLAQSIHAKKSTLCPKASNFTPKQRVESPVRQPESVVEVEAEAAAQPIHRRNTSVEIVPARTEISAPATLSTSAQVYQTIIPVPLLISVLPVTAAYQPTPSTTCQRDETSTQPLRPVEVNGGLKASRWASRRRSKMFAAAGVHLRQLKSVLYPAASACL